MFFSSFTYHSIILCNLLLKSFSFILFFFAKTVSFQTKKDFIMFDVLPFLYKKRFNLQLFNVTPTFFHSKTPVNVSMVNNLKRCIKKFFEGTEQTIFHPKTWLTSREISLAPTNKQRYLLNLIRLLILQYNDTKMLLFAVF